METIGRVRHAFRVGGKKIKEIAREFRLARNTVRGIVRGDATEHRYERTSQPLPRLGGFADQLDGLLEANAKKAKRERLTCQQMFEELRLAGYQGGYDAVRRYGRRWQDAQGAREAEAYVPLAFDPGKAYQFDWSHESVVIAGSAVTVKVAHVRLCYSRMPLLRAYPREAQEIVFDAHDQAFQFFKGVCRRRIYDNMKTAVDAIYIGKERQFNRRFAQLISHHLVEPAACTPASGWEKGQAENQVGVMRRAVFTPRLKFASLAELNAYLIDRCIAWAKAHAHPDDKTRAVFEVFEIERASLVPYAGPFDGFRCVSAAVSKTCLVTFDKNK